MSTQVGQGAAQPENPEQNGATAASAASGDVKPGSALRVVTFIWLLIVMLGMVALVVALGVGLFLTALLSASNSIPSLAVPIAIAVAFVSSLWILFARKKYAAALLASVLIPLALYAVGTAASFKRESRSTPEARHQRLAARARAAPEDDGAWVELGDFYRSEGRADEAVGAYVRVARAYAESWGGTGTVVPEGDISGHAFFAIGEMVREGRATVPATPGLPTGLLPEMLSQDFGVFGSIASDRFLTGLGAAALGYNDIAIVAWQEVLDAWGEDQSPRTKKILAKGVLNSLHWYREAADLGNARAQTLLGHLFLNGVGSVPADYAQAYYWLLIAYTGDTAAVSDWPGVTDGELPRDMPRDILGYRASLAKNHLSSKQLDATERAARAWTSKRP